MRNLFLITALFHAVLLSAQDVACYPEDPRGSARDHSVNYLHLSVNLDVYPFEQRVSGFVDLSFSPLRESVDSIWLDAPGIEIKEVRQLGKKLGTIQNNKGLFVLARKPWRKGEVHQIRIEYEAWPRKGLYFSGWDDDPQHGQVWSQGQGIDNRHWIPHFDGLNNKLTTEVIVRFDSAYQVVSNGALVSQKTLDDGRIQWHWQQNKPHSSYLIMLGIADYNYRESTSSSGVPMRHYFYPEWQSNARWVYTYTEDIMDWLEDLTQTRYPWANYKQIPVRDFLYGAMENTTATIFNDLFYTDSAHFDVINYVFINAHEMAHQWFGNLVTAWSPQHHWLQESFATYFHLKVQEEFLSPDRYDFERHSNARNVKYATLMSNLPVAHSGAGSARHYAKGALVLTMLEDLVGEENFREGMAYYLRRFAYDNARSENLKDAMHRVSGISLDTFFDQWIYRDGEPHLQVEAKQVKSGYWLVFSQDSSKLNTPRLFNLDITYEVYERRNKFKQHSFRLKKSVDSVYVKGNPRFVIIDPRKRLLAHWKMDLPNKWWVNQSYEAPYAIDRRYGYEQSKDSKMTYERAGGELFGQLRAYWLSEALKDTVVEYELFHWVEDPHYNTRLIAYQAVSKLPQQNQQEWYERGLSDANEYIQAYCLKQVLPFWTPEQALPKLQAIRPDSTFDMGEFRWVWYSAMLQQYDPGDEGALRAEIESYFRSRYMSTWRAEALSLIDERGWWSDDNIRWLYRGYAHYDRSLRKECLLHIERLRKNEGERMSDILAELYSTATPQQAERWKKWLTDE